MGERPPNRGLEDGVGSGAEIMEWVSLCRMTKPGGTMGAGG